MEFKELDAQVRAAGLYEPTPVKYIVHFVLATLGVLLSFYFLSVTDNLFLQIANGIFSAFVLVQAGMLGHDLSHGQVFKSEKYNHLGGAFIWGFFGGLSEGGWYEKHNAHHKHVNHEGLDPDLEVPFIFSSVQVADKPLFVRRYIQPYQHILFFVMLPFVYPNIILRSSVRVLTTVTIKNMFEAFLMITHFAIIFYLAFTFLPVLVAIAFCTTSFLFSGLYMGMVFAPNHKGEEVLS
ncbi:MAG: fatty acid desaturase, partial [Patiriisocius sp.]